MSNAHGVSTRKKLTPELIDDVLNKLNVRVFKGLLSIVRTGKTYGDWKIDLTTNGRDWMYYECWLNSPNQFQSQYRGTFSMWIDSVIANEISVLFNGNIWDSGVKDKWKGKPGQHDSLPKFLELLNCHIQNEDHKKLSLQLELINIPVEFRHINGGI